MTLNNAHEESEKEIDDGQMDWNRYPIMLKPEHVKEILNIGRRATFDLLNQDNPPFVVHRYGPRKIRIPKESLRKHVEGRDSNI